jgi:elongation factor Ts
MQPFIKDPGKSIQDLITETVAKTGENIKVRRFVRYELGY